MTVAKIIRGPLLNPTPDGGAAFFVDGAIVIDEHGLIAFVGEFSALRLPPGEGRGEGQRRAISPEIEISKGILAPPFLDAHIHIPQHPIRGKFTDGVDDHDPNGRLLAGLLRNVFPVEAKCDDRDYTRQLVKQFEQDTLSHGVVGGAAFMSIHPDAADAALAALNPFWHVGLVLMNQNCPAYIQNNESVLPRYAAMASKFGPRVIVTDRFAVAVSSPLRQAAADVAKKLGLRMQTHLNEQRQEKWLVERDLYPQIGSYTGVYQQDGLLDRNPILAHCIHLRDDELSMLADSPCAIAHCPTSNTLLGSGTMPLDRIVERNLDWAICTDVGASPTTSLLAEMAQFLKVHAGRSAKATPSVAFNRITLAPARILGLDKQVGQFAIGIPASYVEIDIGGINLAGKSADDVIATALLANHMTPPAQAVMDRLAESGLNETDDLAVVAADTHATAAALDGKVLSITIAGKQVWAR